MATTFEERLEPAAAVEFDDFWWIAPLGEALFVPTREPWPASSVDGALGKAGSQKASQWLAGNRAAQQLVWAPGEPLIVKGKLMAGGGWFDRAGATVINSYRPPEPLIGGDAAKAQPWMDLVRRIYPDDVDHMLDCFAHRVQRPAEKLNHALVLGGNQGIGKDSMLEPLKCAIGPWNWSEVSPGSAMNRFNGFLKCVALRVSEARDLGDHDRFAFYDKSKTWIAAPPDVHMIDEKNRREYPAQNVCWVVITTNRLDALHLEPDDRRHYVAWSQLDKDAFAADHWQRYWNWLDHGNGYAHVAAFLKARDLRRFDPKAPPKKTSAFWNIVSSARPVESGEMADALEKLGWPEAVTLGRVSLVADSSFAGWMGERRNAKAVPHRLADCGYSAVRNPGAVDGRWRIGGRNIAAYAKAELPERDKLAAVQRLQNEEQ